MSEVIDQTEESLVGPETLRSSMFDAYDGPRQARWLELAPGLNDRSLGKPDGNLRQRLFKKR